MTNMSIEKRLAYRESKQITVLGYQVPHAISTFEQLVQSLEKVSQSVADMKIVFSSLIFLGPFNECALSWLE